MKLEIWEPMFTDNFLLAFLINMLLHICLWCYKIMQSCMMGIWSNIDSLEWEVKYMWKLYIFYEATQLDSY